MALSIIFLDLQRMTPRERKSYRPLLDKSLWMSLKGLDPLGVSEAEIFAMAILNENEHLVGLAVVTYYRINFLAQLISFRFTEDYCTPEIFKLALDTLRQKLVAENCLLLTYSYSSFDLNSPMIENLFKQAGSGSPQLVLARCYFDLQAFAPDWLNYYKKNQIPSDVTILPWKNLTSEEHQRLKAQQLQGRFIASVSPYSEENRRDVTLSLAARRQGEIIGWIILHRIASDTLRFSAFYVDPDFRTSRVSAWLLARAIILAQQTKIPKALFEFNLNQVDQSWIDFVKKRLSPFAEKIERIYEVGIALRD